MAGKENILVQQSLWITVARTGVPLVMLPVQKRPSGNGRRRGRASQAAEKLNFGQFCVRARLQSCR
jgi:hypothetical protein